MATAIRPPRSGAARTSKILSVECELTSRCQLECSHCCTLSGPKMSHGLMELGDWTRVVDDIAALGIPSVQFIGGEPTLSPHLLPLIDHALERGLAVEVYSNLTHVRPALWASLDRPGVRLATSYYTDDPEQHDEITGGRGSYLRTRENIVEALGRGIPLRVGMVDVIDGQRVAEGEAELRALGVKDIRIDRVRQVGRAAEASGTEPTAAELCGRCYHQRVAISPDGEVYGCILSRFMPTGNVRTESLRMVLIGPRWIEARGQVTPPGISSCASQDGSDCDPASTPSCDPQ